MRACYFTDLHLYDRDISTRMDRSSEAVLEKLRFLVRLAAREGCDVLLSGGDLFQDKIDSDAYKAEIIRILHDNGATFPFYSLVGNHDILWRSFDTYNKRAMAILAAADVMQPLDTQLLEHGILGVSAFNEDVIDNQDLLRIRIIFAHHYINSGPDKLVLDLKALKAKLPELSYVFTGHDHQEYPTVEIDGVKVVRPGGAMRVSTATESVQRKPKALIIDFDQSAPGGVRSIGEVLIPCRPAEEVFNLDTKSVAKDIEHQLDAFMDNLATSKATGYDLESVVRSKLEAAADPELTEYVSGDMSNLLSA